MGVKIALVVLLVFAVVLLIAWIALGYAIHIFYKLNSPWKWSDIDKNDWKEL